MLSGRWAFVSRFRMVVAHNIMVVHLLVVLCRERAIRNCERRLCCYRTVQTGGLSPHIWITTRRRLYAAKVLGVCAILQKFSVFPPFLTKSDSRVWHQVLRRPLTSNTNSLTKALHLPRGTFTTRFKLFTNFFISGLIHATGEYILFQNFSEGKSIQFFLLQAVGITFEDALVAIASHLGYRKPSVFSKLIGFVWVFAWFTFCLPMWLDPQLHAGMMDNDSVILRLPKRIGRLIAS